MPERLGAHIDQYGAAGTGTLNASRAVPNGGYARANNYEVFTPCDVGMYAAAACGLTVARSSAVRAS